MSSSPRSIPGLLPDGDVVRHYQQMHLEPRVEVIAEARQFVVSHAEGVDEQTCDVLRLLTSELVTNAVLHAGTPLELGVTTSDRSIAVTVADEAAAGPSRFQGKRDGGWGLGLVAALSEEWAIVHHTPTGKTAWFRLPRHPERPAAQQVGLAQ